MSPNPLISPKLGNRGLKKSISYPPSNLTYPGVQRDESPFAGGLGVSPNSINSPKTGGYRGLKKDVS
jgi:hypothetical protein